MLNVTLAICLLAAPASAPKRVDSARIEQITGLKGQWAEKEGVFKVQVPRSDLSVTTAGAKMTPPLGLTAWAAFTRAGPHAVVMGVLEGELQDVLKALRAGGINVVAIHQHMTHEQPRMLFLHYWGVGRAEDLARALASALKKTKVA